MTSMRKRLGSMYFAFSGWTPIETISYGGKTMYLDYETGSVMDIWPILRAYRMYNLDYHVSRNCLGIYEVYCEKIVWGAG